MSRKARSPKGAISLPMARGRVDSVLLGLRINTAGPSWYIYLRDFMEGELQEKESITPERIDELLAYLPVLESPGRPFIEKWEGGEKQKDGTLVMSFPAYSADVEEFFRKASQPWWCDYAYKPEEAGRMLQDGVLVRNATLDHVKTMLTYCVRGERFCSGFWEGILASGQVQDLLRRLKVLREELRPKANSSPT
jgi:hypothetical protein